MNDKKEYVVLRQQIWSPVAYNPHNVICLALRNKKTNQIIFNTPEEADLVVQQRSADFSVKLVVVEREEFERLCALDNCMATSSYFLEDRFI